MLILHLPQIAKLAIVSLTLSIVCEDVLADRIVLRTLRSVQATVTSFDEDGVRLEDGKVLGWHEIRSGTVSATKQEQFDAFIKSLADNLYRIRIRLQNRDYAGLKDLTEAVYGKYSGRKSKTAYMVFQATMWARMANANRSGAVAPYLQCYAYLRDAKKLEEDIPGDRRLEFDPKTGMTSELLPIWFDGSAAKRNLPELGRAIRSISSPPMSARIYYGSLAIASGDVKTAERMLSSLRGGSGEVLEYLRIVEAYRDMKSGKDLGAHIKLRAQLPEFSKANQPLANYLIGAHEITSGRGDLEAGLLRVLQIVASHSEEHPDLAAAALAIAAEGCEAERHSGSMQNRQRASILRNELLRAFPASYQARSILKEINVQDDDTN